ncbi:MAG TPA: four-carbon acid sugar kinase family protein [Puia sp.]|nr:four-carbon acid sugar kinase family protein [Puia sp.]
MSNLGADGALRRSAGGDMNSGPKRLLLAFYGDDFTGSTDALEFLSRAGARTVLFLEPPEAAQLQRYPDLEAIGIAGMTRAMTPGEMEAVLRPAFEMLAGLRVPHIHYKVCSTFDSSPSTGSIGRAIDIGADVFEARFVPVLGGAPALGRYCVFGNLFARMGIGSAGNIYRVDRHPSMSRHPVTPADESDLRVHLGRQTSRAIGLLDILELELGLAEQRKVLERSAVTLIDVLYTSQLAGIGELLDGYGSPERPLFTVGSSAVEMALGDHWRGMGRLTPVEEWPEAGRATPLLVASGSCSPVTAGQIAWAKGQGFAEIALDAAAVAEWGKAATGGTEGTDDFRAMVQSGVGYLSEGRSLILHTGHTPLSSTPAALLGTGLGRLTGAIVGASRGLRRLVIAGGDTSSYAARALGIEAVEMICPLIPGAPLCRAHAQGSPVDGMEINLKGGQVGAPDYFGTLLTGKK